MQEVHAIGQREGPDAGLGFVLPRVSQDLQTAAAGSPAPFYFNAHFGSYTAAKSNVINHAVNVNVVFIINSVSPSWACSCR